MSKRPSLAAALHEAGAKPAIASIPVAGQGEAVPASSPLASPKRPASRVGQRVVTMYTSPEAHKQLRLLSIETGDSVQDLMTKALNELFRQHGKSLIA